MIPFFRKIFYKTSKEGKTKETSRQNSKEQDPPEDDSVPWENNDLLQLFESGEESDVVLQCGDGRFKIHTGVLSERTDVFDAMFKSSNYNPVLHITDTGPQTLEEMLRFIYSGKMPTYQSIHHTMKLFVAANIYEVEPLKRKCLNLMKTHINEDNACDILAFADNRKIGRLKDVAISFLVEKKRFLLSETFKMFSESHPELAIEVLLAFVRKTSDKV